MAPTAPPARSTPYDAYSAEHVSLRRQVLRECEEMAEFALASGLRVPPAVMKAVEAAVSASRTAKAAGLEQPDDPDGAEIARLAAAHEQLSRIVSPATPRTLVILADHREDGSRLGFLGPVPFVRRMMLVAAVSLISFVLLIVMPGITGDVEIHNGQGIAFGDARYFRVAGAALGNYFLLLSAASMGASFAALFQANQFITERTYDPQHEVSYWIKWVVGLMAGLMLCVLIPLDLGEEGSVAAALDKPLLALLGGFSAAAVHRILNRLVESVESLVRGSSKEMVAAAQEQSRLRAETQTEQVRLKMAASLVDLQKQMQAGGDPEALRRQLDGMVNTLVPERLDGVAALEVPAPAPAAWGNGAAAPGAGFSAAGAPAGPPAWGEAGDDDEEDQTERRMAFRDALHADASTSEVAPPPPSALQAVSAYGGAVPPLAYEVGEADEEEAHPAPAAGAVLPPVAPAPLPANADEAVG